jgi:hypothetical protein
MNFNYLKTTELADFVKRGDEIEEGDESYWIGVASSLIDAFCNQSLGISDYSDTIRLTRNGVGYIKHRPVYKVTPQETTTGVRIRPLGVDADQSTVSVSNWQDVQIPANLEDLINAKTGRFEIASFFKSDYGRFFSGVPHRRQTGIRQYEAVIEYTAGYLVNTILTSDAAVDDTVIEVLDTTGIKVNKTYITFGDAIASYRVTAISGNNLTISPALVAEQTENTDVYQVVPNDIKRACGMIIEDRVTYPANTKKMSSKLDVLTDFFDRANSDAIPVDAARILSHYKVH